MRTVADPLVLALDSSTTATKALVVDGRGRVLAQGASPIEMDSPAALAYEQDPTAWWTSTDAAIASAVNALNDGDAERIVAIGLTQQRETFAPFDADGQPLRPGILWLDGRAAAQVRRYASDRVHELTGRPPDATPGLYKMAWLKEHEPHSLRDAAWVTDVHGYLVWNLTGHWTTSLGSADSLGLIDQRAGDYHPDLLEIAGVRRDQLPDLSAPGDVIADLRGDLAARWGLTGPIAVVSGLGDGQAAGLGAAAVEPQVAYLNLGTAIVAGVHAPAYDHNRVYRTLAAGLPGQYVYEVVQNSGAYLATWFRTAFGDPDLHGAPDPELEARATAVAPGSGGLLTVPYWNAVQSPYWEPGASGAMVGWRGAHDQAAMYRSVLESIAYEVARNIRALEQCTGTPITEVRAMGGGLRSGLWRSIITDALGVPVRASAQGEVSAIGAAILAMASVHSGGKPPSPKDVAAHALAMAQLGDVTQPDAAMHQLYLQAGEIQGKIYPALREVLDDIEAFALKYPLNSDRDES